VNSDDLCFPISHIPKTRRRPGRVVHDKEGGRFHAFVVGALEPFNAAWGFETDIKEALKKCRTRARKPKKARTSTT
jgi:hypothetical protein